MRYLILIFSLLFSLYAQKPDAVIKIEKKVDERTSVSIVASSETKPVFRKEVNRLFKADFSVSGHFSVEDNITTASYNALPITLNTKGEYTIVYKFAKTPNAGASLDIKVLKGNPKKQILVKNYSVSKLEKAPFLVHRAVSEINKLANFPPIDWINRYVVVAKYTGAKETEILLADYTFTYQKPIIKGGFNMFPKWADRDQKELYYSNYSDKNNLKLYKINIYTGKKSLITTSKGMLICSDVSKDGSKLLLTIAPNSQPDIYVFSGGNSKRITDFSGIDVGGKFADNEQSIVFVSNRLGTPNIFKTSINGGGVQKIVHHGTNNGSVDAYNNQVVYSSKEGRGKFNIYLTDTNGEQTRPLTSGGVNQFPRFSNDGNVVMYIKRDGGNYIGFMNISANKSEVFKLGINRIQSIDW